MVLGLIIGVLVLAVGGAQLVYLRSREKILRSEIKTIYTGFLMGDGENPSPFHVWLENASEHMATAVLQKAKESLGGVEGAMAKQEKALAGDIAEQAMLEVNPLLGLLAQSVPSLRKRLRSNPAAIPAILGLLQRMGTGAQQIESGSNSGQQSFTM